jgi:hypothetical protein
MHSFLLVLLSIGLGMGSKLWAQSPFFPESKIILEIKRFYLIENFFVSLETQLTAGYVNVPVAHGEAEVWNIAFHFLAGLGYDFGKRKD